ncbi:nucleotidyltransferase domain-containing protein [Candidatus Woesearchaeota archaeon]|nr:nucleotidyltransferase domain-containing protein [Candidatus Woesearchaeota archaeon]
MDKKKSLIKKLKVFRSTINSEIPIKKMFLFGSYATGKTRKWSDVDLVIVSPKFRKKKSYQRARRLYDYWDLKYPVDFLCYTPEEFNKLKKQITIVKQAVETGIEII